MKGSSIMKQFTKRMAAMLVAVVMLFSLLPNLPITAHAEDKGTIVNPFHGTISFDDLYAGCYLQANATCGPVEDIYSDGRWFDYCLTQANAAKHIRADYWNIPIHGGIRADGLSNGTSYDLWIVDNIYDGRYFIYPYISKDVYYIAADGSTQVVTDGNFTKLESSSSDLSVPGGWYVVDGNVTINGNLFHNGEMNLILKNAAKLTVNGTICPDDSATERNLNVFAQSNDPDVMGKLVTTGYIGSGSGTISINGGNVEISSSRGIVCQNYNQNNEAIVTLNTTRYAIDGYGGKATVNGGKLIATGRVDCIDWEVNGGSVYVTSTSSALSSRVPTFAASHKCEYRANSSEAFAEIPASDIVRLRGEMRIVPRTDKTWPLVEDQLFVTLPFAYGFVAAEYSAEDPYYMGIFKTANETDMDIDFYKWVNDGMTLRETAAEEMAASETAHDLTYGVTPGGAPYAMYLDNEFDEETMAKYNTVTVIVDTGDYFAELVFWQDGRDANASTKTDDAITSLDLITEAVPADSIALGDCLTVQTPGYFKGADSYFGDEEDEDAAYQIGYYYSLDSDVDFDVYGWEAEEGETNVASVINAELKDYDTKPTPVVVENAPVPMAYYDAIDTWEKGDETASYQTRTYVLEHNGWFYELVFWMGEVDDAPATRDSAPAGAGAVAEVEAIMATLALNEGVDENGICNKCGDDTTKAVGSFVTGFITELVFTKDYDDRFGEEGDKITTISEELSFSIEAITDDAPAFASDAYSVEVENGAAEISIALPTPTTFGDYWYTLTEDEGETAGVEYDTTVYYIHLISAYVKGHLGIVSAQIHTNAPADDGSWRNDDKIESITNAYGEGELTINQTVSGNDCEDTDVFTTTVTLNAGDKTITGNITLSDGTVITPDDWNEDGTVEIVVTLRGDESVTISGIPADVTYTVEQTGTNEDLGYTAPEYTMDEDEDPDATDGETNATGSIGDKLDVVTINNEKNSPIDVGVMLENGSFAAISFAAMAALAYLVLSRKKKYEEAE